MREQVSTEPSRLGFWIGVGAVAFCVAVVGYISATRPVTDSAADEKNEQLVELGRRTYQASCLQCHGDRLKGKPTWHKTIDSQDQAGIPLNADGVTWQLSDQRLFEAIATGVRRRGEEAQKIHKDGFAGKLTDETIWALIAYFKTTWTARQLKTQQETTQRERAAK